MCSPSSLPQACSLECFARHPHFVQVLPVYKKKEMNEELSQEGKNETKLPETGIGASPRPDYHLTANRLRGHGSQNEFY